MSVEHVGARAGAYADSVTLMQVSAGVRAMPGVTAALVAMATELNLELAAGLGFTPPPGAGPNDLLVAVRAAGEDELAAAVAAVGAALGGGQAKGGGTAGAAGSAGAAGAAGQAAPAGAAGGAAQAPRTASAAVRQGGPGLALISVPGPHAFTEAVDALEAGCDVMVFSDNVPVTQEVALKDLAARRGLLVMGPDCGTAVVGAVGLGFSHTVPAGPVGLVAASGTGAQQVLCLLAAAGVGVSAVLGTGGRDLSAAVGGRSARTALAALDADPATEMIMVLGKPPAPEVAAGLREYAAGLATPVRFAFTGPGERDLTAATDGLLTALGRPVPAWPHWPAGPVPTPPAGASAMPPAASPAGATTGPATPPALPAPAGALRGLFAGGTLCYEAMVIASGRLGRIGSNIPLRPDWRVEPQAPATGHVMIDFGDDALTAGRPHPMIDQSLRLARLAAEAADPAVAVILLDVVLGHGAHPDPAAELAPLIAAARQRPGLSVVASLIGTDSDPQGLAGQAAALQAAGAHVFGSNAEAARYACALAGGRGE